MFCQIAKSRLETGVLFVCPLNTAVKGKTLIFRNLGIEGGTASAATAATVENLAVILW